MQPEEKVVLEAQDNKLTQYEKAFNEWVRRYAKEPESFDPILDDEGNAVEDYGYVSARYFDEIMREVNG